MTASVHLRQRSRLETQIQDGCRRPFSFIRSTERGKIGVGFTIDTDFFDNSFDSEGNLFFFFFFFFFFCTKTLCFWPIQPEGDCFASHLKGLKSFPWRYQIRKIFSPRVTHFFGQRFA